MSTNYINKGAATPQEVIMDPFLLLPPTSPEKLIHLNRYQRFIQSRASRPTPESFENHHIVPKIFGMDKKFKIQPWNSIKLSPREHYIAHMILWKAYGGKMAFAFHMMCNTRDKKIVNSRIFQRVRSEFESEMSILMKEVKRLHPPQFSAEEWKNQSRKRLDTIQERYGTQGVVLSETAKRKIAKSQTGCGNSSWAGYFICPYGVFSTIKQAARSLKSSTDPLYNRMKLAPELYYQSKEISSEVKIDFIIKPLKRFRGSKGRILTREWLLSGV